MSFSAKKFLVVFSLIGVFLFLASLLGKYVHGSFTCYGQEYELGRETRYSFFFGTCIIDSGRKDSNGNVIWVRAENDRGLGE